MFPFLPLWKLLRHIRASQRAVSIQILCIYSTSVAHSSTLSLASHNKAYTSTIRPIQKVSQVVNPQRVVHACKESTSSIAFDGIAAEGKTKKTSKGFRQWQGYGAYHYMFLMP